MSKDTHGERFSVYFSPEKWLKSDTRAFLEKFEHVLTTNGSCNDQSEFRNSYLVHFSAHLCYCIHHRRCCRRRRDRDIPLSCWIRTMTSPTSSQLSLSLFKTRLTVESFYPAHEDVAIKSVVSLSSSWDFYTSTTYFTRGSDCRRRVGVFKRPIGRLSFAHSTTLL